MDRYNRFLRAACMALAAALMAGCTAFTAVRALGFALPWLPVYGAALAASAAVQLGRRSKLLSAAAAVAVAAGLAVLVICGKDAIGALLRDFIAERRLDAEALALHASAAQYLALLASVLLGALFAALMRASGGVSAILMVMLTAVICSFAGNDGLSLWLAVPGVAAGVAAFAMSMSASRDGMRPVLLVPAVVVTLLALVLAPSERITWAPLENLASRVRAVVEDYIRFTEERVAFSINEKGYNHAELIGDSVVAMLGGPADPSEGSVMRVQTSHDLLLRGTIKRSYTGYSWIDDQAKARYLYYDFTHRNVRNEVFGAQTGAKDDGFVAVQGTVEMLESGTSTLFVPAVLSEFGMDMANAVYYNSAGEIFLTRDAAPGDSYSFETRLPVSDAALLAAETAAMEAADRRYAEMLEEYTALPEGIDTRVYALAAELTKDAATPAEKALAIQSYLTQNCRYTLDGGYPGLGRDFVSWFLLEEKQGYCSYFASAMAVLCRMNGLPARYVEGYSVRAEEDGETIVTGENAHAWVEVYLSGLGWTSFDPTARAYESQNGDSGEGQEDGDSSDSSDGSETPYGNDDPAESGPDATPTPTPDAGGAPDATPTPNPDGGTADEPTPSPEPNGGSSGSDSDDNSMQDDPAADNPPDEPNPQQEQNSSWLWILLIVLLIIALAYLWIQKRLRESDPLKLCASAQSGQQAAMILYRGILTLLMQAGLVPLSGETPEDFALRAVQAMPNPAYGQFVAGVARSRYSGRPMTKETLEAGRRAYVCFLNGMRRGEKLRYHMRRVLHGIGDLENIP